jgi:hypothetical protein
MNYARAVRELITSFDMNSLLANLSQPARELYILVCTHHNRCFLIAMSFKFKHLLITYEFKIEKKTNSPYLCALN